MNTLIPSLSETYPLGPSALIPAGGAGYPHPTWREHCEKLETALAAAFELKRRAEQPECEPDFQRMPTYVKRLHAELFAALAKIAPDGAAPNHSITESLNHPRMEETT